MAGRSHDEWAGDAMQFDRFESNKNLVLRKGKCG